MYLDGVVDEQVGGPCVKGVSASVFHIAFEMFYLIIGCKGRHAAACPAVTIVTAGC
jgi:hypothetical protein